MNDFSEEEIERYSRTILLGAFGVSGQRRLRESRVFVVGTGGIGSAVTLYLAAAGVGTLTLVDGDVVDRSNLQRQILHGTADIGHRKVQSALETIAALNPNCHVIPIDGRLTLENAYSLIQGHDLVCDGSDNFATRFTVADTCWRAGVPLVSAAAVEFQGQLLSIVPQKGNPCYRCLFPTLPQDEETGSCHRAGILGAVAGVMGCLQAIEAIKQLTGIGTGLETRLLNMDALTGRFVYLPRNHNPHCSFCVSRESHDQ